MEKNPLNIRGIKDAIKSNLKSADEIRKMEREFVADPKQEKRFWGIYDDELKDFDGTFMQLLPEGLFLESHETPFLKRYIEDTLRKEGSTKPLTAVEFGGPGINLFSGFTEGFFAKTAGVTLTDIIQEHRKSARPTHSLIEGNITDIFNQDIYAKLQKALGTAKVDLIISRMAGGVNHINRHPAILDEIIRKWYSILNENGLMFVQFGYNDGESQDYNRASEWIKALKERYPDLDIQLAHTSETIRLHKKEGDPEELPPAKELFANA